MIRADRLVVDALLAEIRRQRDRRLVDGLAVHDEVAAGELLREPPQLHARENHLRSGGADIDADREERDVVLQPTGWTSSDRTRRRHRRDRDRGPPPPPRASAWGPCRGGDPPGDAGVFFRIVGHQRAYGSAGRGTTARRSRRNSLHRPAQLRRSRRGDSRALLPPTDARPRRRPPHTAPRAVPPGTPSSRAGLRRSETSARRRGRRGRGRAAGGAGTCRARRTRRSRRCAAPETFAGSTVSTSASDAFGRSARIPALTLRHRSSVVSIACAFSTRGDDVARAARRRSLRAGARASLRSGARAAATPARRATGSSACRAGPAPCR